MSNFLYSWNNWLLVYDGEMKGHPAIEEKIRTTDFHQILQKIKKYEKITAPTLYEEIIGKNFLSLDRDLKGESLFEFRYCRRVIEIMTELGLLKKISGIEDIVEVYDVCSFEQND